MRCRTCDYALWNLRARVCPECGSPFSVGDYEFVPGSVRFCCAHCNQPYYGTDAKGHLEPREFECVTCGRAVTMDEMVVVPAEGVRDQDTATTLPWMMRRERGFFSSYFRTIGWGFAYAPQIGRALAVAEPGRASWFFAFGTIALTMLLAFSPMMCFMLPVTMGAGGPGGGGGARALWGPLVVFGSLLGGIILGAAIGLWLGPLIAHGTMRLLGSGRGGYNRTLGAVCYTCGPCILSAVPCLGFYIFAISLIWWMISASLALAEAHRDRVWKGVVSMILPALLVPAVPIGAWLIVVFWMMGAGGALGGAPIIAQIATQAKVSSLSMAWRTQAMNASGPIHAAQLLESGFVKRETFLLETSRLAFEDVPVGSLTLADFDQSPGVALSETQQSAIAQAAAALPADVIAHRLGDFVFTYHGIDPTIAPADLWVVIAAPIADPLAPASPIAEFVIGTVGSGVEAIAAADFPAALAKQNDLRARFNLAPLPPPETVTHDQPAVAGDQ